MDLNVRYTSLSDSCMYNFKKHFGEFSLPQHVSIGVSRVTRPLKTNHSDHHIMSLFYNNPGNKLSTSALAHSYSWCFL